MLCVYGWPCGCEKITRRDVSRNPPPPKTESTPLESFSEPGGDFIASSIVNGFEAGADGSYGTADDAPHGLDGNNLIKATIASIVIKGRATGTSSSGDSYGILAEKIGSVTVGGRKIALDPLGNDNVQVGAFADLRIHELPIP